MNTKTVISMSDDSAPLSIEGSLALAADDRALLERDLNEQAEEWPARGDVVAEMFFRFASEHPFQAIVAAWYREGATTCSKPIDAAAEAFFAHERRRGAMKLDMHGINDIIDEAKRFRVRFRHLVYMGLVTPLDMTRWLADVARIRGPGAAQGVQTAVSAFYTYTFGKGGYNPARDAELRKQKPSACPLPLECIVALLWVALYDPKFARYAQRVVLMVVFGLRVALARRLRPGFILRQARKIRIPASINGRSAGRPRVLEGFPEGAWTFFYAAAPMADEEIKEVTMKAALRRMFRRAGLMRTKGELRDTFASSHLCKYQDRSRTAGLLGHSNLRSVDRYIGMVSLPAAEAFLGLTLEHVRQAGHPSRRVPDTSS